MAIEASLSIVPPSDAVLSRLYRDYWSALCGYIHRQFGSGPPEPEDVAQEAFARLAAQQGSWAVENPKAYLMVAARNIAIDAHRKAATGKMAMKSVAVLNDEPQDVDVSEILNSREELQRLSVVIDQLKPKQRAAFLMHRIDGLTFVEIGERLGMSPSGARMLVKAAMTACMKKMKR